MAKDEEKTPTVVEKKIEVVTNDIVDEAVKHINGIVKKTVFDGAKQIGEYVFDTFYDNDIERVKSQNPKKDTSFRKLAERCEEDLLVSKTFLGNAVGVAVMCRRLSSKEKTYEGLSHSLQVALLPLREPKLVEAMAERVSDQKLPVRKVRQLVQDKVEKNKDENLGRPPKSVILKALDRSIKVFTLESGRKSFTKKQVADLEPDEVKIAREKAQELVDSLNKLLAELPKK